MVLPLFLLLCPTALLLYPSARSARECSEPLPEGAAVYESVSLHDMERHGQGETFAYECRCGGLFQIGEDEVMGELGAQERTQVSVACPSCSLWLAIHLDKASWVKGPPDAVAL